MAEFEELTQKVVDVIDNNLEYRIVRAPYGAAFAKAHGVLLEDIQELRYVPCIGCGADISAKILMNKNNHRPPIYCSPACRTKVSTLRLMKLNESTRINDTVTQLIMHGLTVELGKSQKTPSRTTNAILSETNRLLGEILQTLRRGNEKRA